jgi:hypothetical protein
MWLTGKPKYKFILKVTIIGFFRIFTKKYII